MCGSNNKFYNNECLLRRDACKQQSEILVVSEGPCPIGKSALCVCVCGSGGVCVCLYGMCVSECQRMCVLLMISSSGLLRPQTEYCEYIFTRGMRGVSVYNEPFNHLLI